MFAVEKFSNRDAVVILTRITPSYIILTNCGTMYTNRQIDDAYKKICDVYEEFEETVMTNDQHAQLILQILHDANADVTNIDETTFRVHRPCFIDAINLTLLGDNVRVKSHTLYHDVQWNE